MTTLKIQVYEVIKLGEAKTKTPRASFDVLGRLLNAFQTPFRVVNSLPRPPSFEINCEFTSAFSFV